MNADIDKTIPPKRKPEGNPGMENTMPGKRDRKPDGRFEPGDLILNRYKVVSELGQGGMGVVYKCFDETAGIEVALKALPPELSHNTLEMEDIKENFQLVAKLIHQNIAISKNLEKDNSNGNYYLIMECVEGEDLRRWIKRKRKDGTLSLEAVIPVIRQVAEALDYAHRQKVIHRDIKPGNIMISADGFVKVLDFGLAAQIHTSMTRVSMAYHGTSGTGPYMAPEQWEGRAQGANADQYALAVMAYEMLAGHLPFESPDAAILREAVLKSTLQPINGLSSKSWTAIMRAMSKDSSMRFESCTDFADALAGKKISGPAKKSFMPRLIAGIILLLCILAGGAVFMLSDESDKSDRSDRSDKMAEEQAQKDAEAKRLAEEKAQKEAEAKRLAEEKAQKEAEAKRLAEEQAQKEAEAKRLAEEQAQKEAEAKRLAGENARKNEKEIAAKVQAAYRLQAQIERQKEEIEAASYDRGQTFGKHLDTLTDCFKAGTLAMKNDDVSSAMPSFNEALKAIDWITKNAPLREEAKSLLITITENHCCPVKISA